MCVCDDTIAAIATPIGEGGISVVRISGPLAVNIARTIFQPSTSNFFEHFKLHHGHIVQPSRGEVIDEVLLSVMYAPHSYTREDVVEINCHGGIFCAREVLDVVGKQGARIATPGEFTKRAFLNGRIDLVQAEAVIDVIQAKTERALKASVYTLKGGLSKWLEEIKTKLISVLGNIEVQIDFPEEDINPASLECMRTQVVQALEKVENLLQQAVQWHVLREGVKVAIVGKPNVGKSSFLNFIAGQEKAIVTDIPGTTRDIIECNVNIGGIPFRFFDTAGIRPPENVIEEIGVERTRDLVNMADVVIAMVDASEELTEEDIGVLECVIQKDFIVVLNKIDKGNRVVFEDILVHLATCNGVKPPLIKISVKDGINIDEVKRLLLGMIWDGRVNLGSDVMAVNVRHRISLERVKTSLEQFLQTVDDSSQLELLAFDLREGLDEIDEILGKTADEDILGQIFAEFCIGK